MAERVGFEPTVPLPGRMLSKHVDSSTLAPLRVDRQKKRHLSTPDFGAARRRTQSARGLDRLLQRLTLSRLVPILTATKGGAE
ncbi:hypothetical protein NITMOv2_0202 [Nitrospira moscoviensis]|uniref:Uncharacterized protein n=1 Tax=Nitrospira moscoviensis TaxID=42253 RepID=A0A0K2G7Q2_NITMO|nr:hypothetical protein NITMOv2_0202 [Nitrospira moscoviensis]